MNLMQQSTKGQKIRQRRYFQKVRNKKQPVKFRKLNLVLRYFVRSELLKTMGNIAMPAIKATKVSNKIIDKTVLPIN